MASLRTGTGLPSRPSEGIRARRTPAPEIGSSGSIPRPAFRTTRSDMDTTSRPVAQAMGQSRLPSRVPQPSSSSSFSRPSMRQSTVKQSPDHETTSFGSASTSTSSPSRSHTQSGSGSSTSSRSQDSNMKGNRNVLRRKKTTIGDDSEALQVDPSAAGIPPTSGSRGYYDPGLGIQFDRDSTNSPAQVHPTDPLEPQKMLIQSPVVYPELDRYRDHRRPVISSADHHFELPYKLSTENLPPPTPGSILFSASSSQMSASPSTKFSGSPGPGPFSRDTTPTSISSQSPGLVAPIRFNTPKVRQMSSPSQTRPPVTRRRTGSIPNEVDAITADPQGLAAVRESLTSSSSSSTVKDGDRNSKKDKRPTRRLPPPPPSPPPRKSSQMSRRQREDDREFASRPTGRPQPSHTPSPAPQSPPVISSRQQRIPSPTKSAAPRRPSRDGTPDIHSQLLNHAPIIHSNLSSSSLPAERRASESNDLAPSYERQKNASTSQLPTGRHTASPSKSAAAPSASKKLAIPEPIQTSRTPSPNISSSFHSRFPFFSRKKNTTDSAQTEKKEKKEKKTKPRKGPAAGTGHEGYGRIGAVRRRSGSGNLSRGAQDASMESLVGNDAFLADRMNPVVISGGSIIENRNASSELSRTESNQSLPVYRPSIDSGPVSDVSSASRGHFSSAPRSLSAQQMTLGGHGSRRPSDSSDSEGPAMKHTLAFRRSVQRLRSSPEDPFRLPQPINTTGVASSPMTSFDTSVMSDESYGELQREVSRGSDVNHPPPKKLTKRSRSPRKWNIFGRSHSSNSQRKDEQIPAAVQSSEKKPVPFYAMMDSSEHEDTDTGDIQAVLRNADVYTSSPKHLTPEALSSEFSRPEVPRAATSTPPLRSRKVFHEPFPQDETSLRYEPPAQTKQASAGPAAAVPPNSTAPASTAVPATAAAPTTNAVPAANATPIIATVETEHSAHADPAVSPTPLGTDYFGAAAPAPLSLPGRPSRLQQVGRIPKVISNRQEQPSPKSFSRPFQTSMQMPQKPVNLLDPESIAKGPSPEGSTAMTDLTQDGSTAESGTNFSISSEAKSPPDSEPENVEFLRFSPRKNSEGTLGTSSSSGVNPFATATAVIPLPNDPPAEDEIWDEYNDLMGLDHAKSRISARSSKGALPLHLEQRHDLVLDKPMQSPTLAFDSRKSSIYSKAPTASSHFSADMTERIRTAFQPHPSPLAASAPDFSDQRDLTPILEGESPVEDKPRTPSPEPKRESEASYSSSEDNSPLAQVNLRVGSMTVSKWLTFGHVLFSDVRHELITAEGSLKRQSILVIDGLGNDDWSFYAAETYPAATFFNLSPRAPLPAEVQSSASGFPLSPPNHHQIQYFSHSEKFPFAPQSFTSVVYRFPIAAPESHYWNILTEARRVLKPDGYLELSILDVDLNNMGNRGRRVVRQLKESIHQASPDTTLASTADLIVRLIGKAGFTNIKAARVGVPVATPVTRAKDKRAQDQPKREQPSLSEMMSDNSSTADEGITKMVARVGRWWYTRCYETAADSLTVSSIWEDKALLRECEELGTSLKLMVCCGRAPERVLSI